MNQNYSFLIGFMIVFLTTLCLPPVAKATILTPFEVSSTKTLITDSDPFRSLNPTIINGNVMLCPDGTETLSTQEFDSYQWYRGGSPIPGATGQTLMIDYFNYAGYNVSVFVTLGEQSAMSPSILVDGYMFLPVTVASYGTGYWFSNDVWAMCPENELFFELMLPYNTNIQWFRNNEPIPDANNNIFQVRETGVYYVTGAPAVCPDFVQFSVLLSVEVYTPPVPEISQMADTLFTSVYPGQWFAENTLIPGATGRFIIPEDPGEYSFEFTNQQGCKTMSDPFFFEPYEEEGFVRFINAAKGFENVGLMLNGEVVVENFSTGRTTDLIPVANNSDYLVQLFVQDTEEMVFTQELNINIYEPDVMGMLIILAGEPDREGTDYSLRFFTSDYLKIEPNDHGHWDVVVFQAFTNPDVLINYVVETEPGEMGFPPTDWAFGGISGFPIAEPHFILSLTDPDTEDVIVTYKHDVSQFVGLGWDLQMVLLDHLPGDNKNGDFPTLLAAPHREGWLAAPEVIIPVNTTTLFTGENIVRAYPNPFSKKINLQVQVSQPGLLNVEMISLTGQVFPVHSSNLSYGGVHEVHIPIDSLTPGFYMLRATTPGYSVTLKMVKK